MCLRRWFDLKFDISFNCLHIIIIFKFLDLLLTIEFAIRVVLPYQSNV